MTLQRGYDYREEIDAYLTGIRDSVFHTEQYEGTDAAVAKLDDVIESLDRVRDEIERAPDPNR